MAGGCGGALVAAFAHGVALMIIIYTWGTGLRRACESGGHARRARRRQDRYRSGRRCIGLHNSPAPLAPLTCCSILLGKEQLQQGQTLGLFSVDPATTDAAKVIIIEAVLTFFLVSAVYSAGIFNRFGNAVGLAIGLVLDCRHSDGWAVHRGEHEPG